MILQDPLFGLDIDGYGYQIILAATIVYALLTICGLVTVSLFMAVLIKARSVFKEYPFFTIVWQVTISNTLNLLAQATCIIPCTFLDSREGDLSVWYTVGAYMIDFTDYSVSFFVFLMALNRFAVFVAKPLAKAFTKSSVFYSIFVTWLAVIAIFIVKVNFGPIQTNASWGFIDFFIRKDVGMTVIILIGYLVPVAILLIYISIYAYIRKRRSTVEYSKNQDKNDVALLWQGFAIALSLIFFRTINTFAPRIETVLWLQWLLNVLRGMTSVGNHMLNPILFLTTNKTVRRVVREMFRRNARKKARESSVFFFGTRMNSVSAPIVDIMDHPRTRVNKSFRGSTSHEKAIVECRDHAEALN